MHNEGSGTPQESNFTPRVDRQLSLELGGGVFVSLSTFFPLPAAALGVALIDPHAFQSKCITSTLIPRSVQIFGSSSFHLTIHFHQFHSERIQN
jgi:hypothetical protein